MPRLALAIATSLLIAPASSAGSFRDAVQLYSHGDYRAAATVAAGLRTPEGLVFAAKATSTFAAGNPGPGQDSLFSQAESLCRQAIRLDPRNPDAYVELSRAIGGLVSARGPVASVLNGYANETRESLETALRLDPGHANAMTGLAIWHASLSAAGVGWLFGADAGRAVTLFERAIELEPGVINHRVNFAVVLLKLDRKRWLVRARGLLEGALRMGANDWDERLSLERARRELAGLPKF